MLRAETPFFLSMCVCMCFSWREHRRPPPPKIKNQGFGFQLYIKKKKQNLVEEIFGVDSATGLISHGLKQCLKVLPMDDVVETRHNLPEIFFLFFFLFYFFF